jgi:hypothetical protein
MLHIHALTCTVFINNHLHMIQSLLKVSHKLLVLPLPSIHILFWKHHQYLCYVIVINIGVEIQCPPKDIFSCEENDHQKAVVTVVVVPEFLSRFLFKLSSPLTYHIIFLYHHHNVLFDQKCLRWKVVVSVYEMTYAYGGGVQLTMIMCSTH